MTATQGEKGEGGEEGDSHTQCVIVKAILSDSDTDSSEELHICLPFAARSLCRCV